jgi:hypothetical protein
LDEVEVASTEGTVFSGVVEENKRILRLLVWEIVKAEAVANSNTRAECFIIIIFMLESEKMV